MPRKQRFKPSRKPKPIPQNEEPMTVRQPSSASAHGEAPHPPGAASPGEDASARAPDPDERSR